MFGATNTIKNSDKEKYLYSGYRLAFDWNGEWRFGNNYARNIRIFGVDNSSSSHSENHKNNFSILGEGPTLRINGRFESSEKRLISILVKWTQNFIWVCIIIMITVICFLLEKKSLNIKLIIKVLIFQLSFAWEIFLMV